MYFRDENCKRMNKLEKMARKANRRSIFVLVISVVFLGTIAASDEITFKRRDKEGA